MYEGKKFVKKNSQDVCSLKFACLWVLLTNILLDIMVVVEETDLIAEDVAADGRPGGGWLTTKGKVVIVQLATVLTVPLSVVTGLYVVVTTGILTKEVAASMIIQGQHMCAKQELKKLSKKQNCHDNKIKIFTNPCHCRGNAVTPHCGHRVSFLAVLGGNAGHHRN